MISAALPLPGALMMLRLSVLIVSLLAALPAAAQIYQWKDAQGRTHYSDTPPPKEPVRTIREAKPRTAPVVIEEGALQGEGRPESGEATPAANGNAEPAKPPTLAEKDAEFRKRQAASAEAAEKAEKERQRKEELSRKCDEARGQAAALQSGQRMVRFSASGEREVLDDAGRASALEGTQKFIADNCK